MVRKLKSEEMQQLIQQGSACIALDFREERFLGKS